MKANELRIGNIVEYPEWNNDNSRAYFRVRDIYTDDNRLGLTNGFIQLPCSKTDYVEPVALTEEWLLKFGFDWVVNTTYSMVDGRDFKCYLKDDFTYNDIQKLWWYNHSVLKVQPKYVHQLQNLYFALTGEELTIKN